MQQGNNEKSRIPQHGQAEDDPCHKVEHEINRRDDTRRFCPSQPTRADKIPPKMEKWRADLRAFQRMRSGKKHETMVIENKQE